MNLGPLEIVSLYTNINKIYNLYLHRNMLILLKPQNTFQNIFNKFRCEKNIALLDSVIEILTKPWKKGSYDCYCIINDVFGALD